MLCQCGSPGIVCSPNSYFSAGVNVAAAEFGDARDDSSWQCCRVVNDLREVSQCTEKSISRAFSALKVPTSATGLLDTTGRHEIGTLVCKDNNQ